MVKLSVLLALELALFAGLSADKATIEPLWVPPVALSGTVPYGVTAPQVAINDSGDAVAAWSYHTGSDFRVRARFRSAGDPWGSVVEWPGWVSSPPVVAIAEDGEATVAWARSLSNGTSLAEAVRRSKDGHWDVPEQLSSPEDGWVVLDSVRAGVDLRGNTVALWNSSIGFRSSYRPAGSSWQQPVTVSTNYGWSPVLDVSESGRSIVAWEGFDDSDKYAFFTASGEGGRWQRTTLVATERTPLSYPGGLSAAVNAEGAAVVAWHDSEHGNAIVSAAYHPAGTQAWQLTPDLSFADGNAQDPAVGIDSSGNAIAAWDASVDVEGASRLSGAEDWQRPVVVGSSTGAPLVAVNPAGEAVAAWRSYASGALEASIRPASGTWRPSSPSDRPIQALGSLAIDSQANALAAWDDGGGRGVWAAALDAAGPVMSGLVVPSRGYPQQRLSFSLTPRDAWSGLGGLPTWIFGDRQQARGRTVTHAYSAPGRYQIVVNATDGVGHTSTVRRQLLIERVRPPRLIRRPKTTGSPVVGEILSCSRGVWTGTVPIRVAYGWLRSGQRIEGATGRRYRLSPVDSRTWLRCAVTASNLGGSREATSTPVRVRARTASR